MRRVNQKQPEIFPGYVSDKQNTDYTSDIEFIGKNSRDVCVSQASVPPEASLTKVASPLFTTGGGLAVFMNLWGGRIICLQGAPPEI